MNDKHWPFDQPRNGAIFTIRQITNGELPILVVYHDEDDHGWQFLSNTEILTQDAMIVSLESITKIDPTVFEIANMDPGFHAWRKSEDSKWTIEKTAKHSEEQP